MPKPEEAWAEHTKHKASCVKKLADSPAAAQAAVRMTKEKGRDINAAAAAGALLNAGEQACLTALGCDWSVGPFHPGELSTMVKWLPQAETDGQRLNTTIHLHAPTPLYAKWGVSGYEVANPSTRKSVMVKTAKPPVVYECRERGTTSAAKPIDEAVGHLGVTALGPLQLETSAGWNPLAAEAEGKKAVCAAAAFMQNIDGALTKLPDSEEAAQSLFMAARDAAAHAATHMDE